MRLCLVQATACGDMAIDVSFLMVRPRQVAHSVVAQGKSLHPEPRAARAVLLLPSIAFHLLNTPFPAQSHDVFILTPLLHVPLHNLRMITGQDDSAGDFAGSALARIIR